MVGGRWEHRTNAPKEYQVYLTLLVMLLKYGAARPGGCGKSSLLICTVTLAVGFSRSHIPAVAMAAE